MGAHKETIQDLLGALLITVLLSSTIIYSVQAATSAVSLTATIQSALTFTTSSNQFGNVTPGTVAWATTTLDVATNATNGWNVALSGDNKATGINNMQLGANTASITDQTEWVPGAATTSGGTAVVQASLSNSGNVLAFRVMSASSTNGAGFLSTGWWGTSDIAGTAKWAGIASTTNGPRQIGNAGAGTYSASNHLNTVQYYLNVSATQPTGSYTAPLTYTATAQP